MMHAYIEVRRQCERALAESGLPHTILRPWYVLGPGHWWPYALMPIYLVMERIPATRESAQRLGLVTHGQMVNALEWAVWNPPERGQILDVPDIRRAGDESRLMW
jgi:uncharacterized protein YbjT (DUF2867 family)